MKFMIFRTSQPSWREDQGTVEINTIEELLALSEKEGNHIIVTPASLTGYRGEDNLPMIEVYDDYRE